MHDSQIAPLGRSVAGFFPQFADGGFQYFLPRIDLAGGQFEEHLPHRVAVLAFEEQLAIIEHGNDHHGTGMDNVLPHPLMGIRQAHLVAPHVKQAAPPDLFGTQGFLDEMGIGLRLAFQVGLR